MPFVAQMVSPGLDSVALLWLPGMWFALFVAVLLRFNLHQEIPFFWAIPVIGNFIFYTALAYLLLGLRPVVASRYTDRGHLSRYVTTKGLVVVMILAALLIGFFSVESVRPGHVGVLTTQSGDVTGQVLTEGIHLVWPWLRSSAMDVRTREIRETALVHSREGRQVTIEISLLFHLDPAKAADVLRRIGPDYVEIVVKPNLRSAVRRTIASYNADALKTKIRKELAQGVGDALREELRPQGIIAELVLIHRMDFLA